MPSNLLLTRGLGLNTGAPGPSNLALTGGLGAAAATPPPPPTPSTMPPGGAGGTPWTDRDKDFTDFLADVERLRQGELGARAAPAALGVTVFVTSLLVEVHVTILDVEVSERGNLVYLIARFGGDPDEVNFSYLPPHQHRPVVDVGFGQDGSKITRLEEGVYTYEIDTTGFQGGRLKWHFWSTGAFQKSDFDEIEIPDRPPQLL